MIDRQHVLLCQLAEIRDLPTLPEAVARLEAVARRPDGAARDFAAIIETDPPMAARLLRLANSSYYGGARGIATLSQAIVRIGLAEVRRVCLAIAAMRVFVRPSALVDHRRFWRHCLAVASATRIIAAHSRLATVDADAAYVAGLLHDVGALILDQYFERIYRLVLTESRRTRRPIHLVEDEYLRLTHARVGQVVLERWRLPEAIVAAVGNHHEPAAAPPDALALAQIVHLADHIACSQGIAGPGEEHVGVMSVKACEDLGLDLAELYKMTDAVARDAQRSSLFLDAVAA